MSKRKIIIIILSISFILYLIISTYEMNKYPYIEDKKIECDGIIIDSKNSLYSEKATLLIEGELNRAHSVDSFNGKFLFNNTSFDFESINYNGDVEIFFSHSSKAASIITRSKGVSIRLYNKNYFEKVLIQIEDGNKNSKFFVAPCNSKEEAVVLANELIKGKPAETAYKFK